MPDGILTLTGPGPQRRVLIREGSLAKGLEHGRDGLLLLLR